MAEALPPLSEQPTPALLLGLGSDIIEVERIRRAGERHPERFVARILTEGEREYCFRMKDPWPHVAARFAVKEAVSKAFTTGIGARFEWKSASVRHGSRGQPLVVLDALGAKLLTEVGGTEVRISLSHTKSYAEAVAAVVRHA